MDDVSSHDRIELEAVDPGPDGCVRLRRGAEVAEVRLGDGPDRLEAVAAATVVAIGLLVPPVVDFALDGIHLITGRRPILVAAVIITVADVPLLHVGSAVVHDGPAVAAAKATLAAVNRRLEILGH